MDPSVHRIAFPLPQSSKIKTEEFLSACSNFLNLIGLFGKTFAPAVYDMSGNVAKITGVYRSDCDKHEYLEDMILAERDEGKQLATDALMWLRRGLNFLIIFFELLCTDESKQEDLGAFVREAYSDTLKMYHGWITRSFFNLLAGMTPKRTALLESLAQHKKDCQEYVISDIRRFIPNLKLCVQHLVTFYVENDLETNNKV